MSAYARCNASPSRGQVLTALGGPRKESKTIVAEGTERCDYFVGERHERHADRQLGLCGFSWENDGPLARVAADVSREGGR